MLRGLRRRHHNVYLMYTFLFQLLLIYRAISTSVKNLPGSSLGFFSSYSCTVEKVLKSLEFKDDDSFFRWVLSARHTTWPPGWEVPMPTNVSDATTDGDKYYARVFDLLNWARENDALPITIDISSVCHKGMETYYMEETSTTDNDINVPTKPNMHIPNQSWLNLWNTCHKQLHSASRTSSSCINIPGILVANPSPPFKVNNPCHLEYRMVDGAHRICLRKYLLAILSGELMELERLPIRKFTQVLLTTSTFKSNKSKDSSTRPVMDYFSS